MLQLSNADFYITNVCNLNCTDCNRFNNFAFSKHYHWHEYQDQYRDWAKILDIEEIGILGGEPMSNPDFVAWMQGVADLWPRPKINIATNGYYLDRWPNFYDELVKYGGRIFVIVSVHNWKTVREQVAAVKKFYPSEVSITNLSNDAEWKTRYESSRQTGWPDCDTVEHFYHMPIDFQNMCYDQVVHPIQIFRTVFHDANNVMIRLDPAIYFQPSAIRFNKESNTVAVYNSDPAAALRACYIKKCHTFLEGKLYKCPVTAHLPEFSTQFQMDISSQQRDLIHSYHAAEANWDHHRLAEFIHNLMEEQVIDQCRLCPIKTDYVGPAMESSSKKNKLIKILNRDESFV